jgi:hypothetical protein
MEVKSKTWFVKSNCDILNMFLKKLADCNYTVNGDGHLVIKLSGGWEEDSQNE